MSFEVKRSPCRITWWLTCNGVIVNTYDRKLGAMEAKSALEKKYL